MQKAVKQSDTSMLLMLSLLSLLLSEWEVKYNLGKISDKNWHVILVIRTVIIPKWDESPWESIHIFPFTKSLLVKLVRS